MKKISRELYRSYMYMIFLFVISFTSILFFFVSYINRNAGSDVKTLDSFLSYETGEYDRKIAKGKSLSELFNDALEECPEVLGTNVYFLHKDRVYSKKSDDGVLEKLDLDIPYEKIRTQGYFNYKYMIKDIKVQGEMPIKLVIVKDMKHERKMIVNVFIITLGIGILALYGSIHISRRFCDEFSHSLRELQNITNSINLDTVGDRIETENRFIEFDMIMNSYRKMLKRLKEQTDVQVDFVNNASHELKTPIFIIGGYINMIKRWGLENRDITNEAIAAIDDEVKTMSNLMSKLLFLAKGDIKEIDNGDVDVKKLFNEIKIELEHLYPSQILNIESPKIHIISDEFLLRQLLINLMENAIKYGKGDKIEIRALLQKGLTIEIEDHGEGISEENLKHIYDKFFRVDKGRSREMGSHGLGLSIVKKISEVLNIDINIISKLGEGTKVILNIPIENF